MTPSSEDRSGVLARFADIAPAERGGRRAAHKPLLLLWALGRLQASGETEFLFADVEKQVDALLGEFGPPWRTTALYPFWHLQSDGVWEVPNAGHLERRQGKDRPTLRAMRRARGGLEPTLRRQLAADPSLIVDASLLLLQQHFEPSLHHAIASACGLALGEVTTATRSPGRRRRDASFRSRVLVAYEFRCAACGWSAFLGRDPLGLDAAHLRWHAFDGPDSLDNGICLCSLHHVALDRGALSVADDRRLLVSAEVHARSGESDTLAALAGQLLRAPQEGMPALGRDHLGWHREQVFRGPARAWAD